MKISVCIPVFNGEKYLRRCLDSVAAQTFMDFEIIVVDDCSPGQDENGWNCKKICKIFTKQTKLKVNYIRFSRNRGCIDARREGIYEAKGEYVLNLDCDDALKPQALETLAAKASDSNADIVHCGAEVVYLKGNNFEGERAEMEKINFQSTLEKVNRLYQCELLDSEVFDHSVIKGDINFFVWGKLIKRDIFISAWEMIPPAYCVWGEDYLIYFFVAFFAKKYVGIPEKLYIYSIDTGISSSEQIETLHRWEKICTVASVFAIIYDAVNNGKIDLSNEMRSALEKQANGYVLQSYRYLQYFVKDEIKQQAYELFCDYWGKEYVEKLIQTNRSIL